MSEEINTDIQEEKKEEKKCDCGCDCNCKCEVLKAFLLVVFGSFLGCLVALCLFGALVKPKMPPVPLQMFGPAPFQQVEHGKFNHQKGMKPDFKKKDFDGRPDMKNFRGGMPPSKAEFKHPEKPDFDED